MHRIAIAILLASTAARAAPTVTITVDPNQVAQTIDGFGVAQARFGPGDPSDNGPQDPARRLFLDRNRLFIMDMTFSALNGIGATILRTKITSALEPSPGQRSTFDEAQAWIQHEAQARGPVKLLATAWSPPPWMKSNGSPFLGRCSNNPAKSCDRDCDRVQNDADGDLGCNPLNTCSIDAPIPHKCLIGKLDFHRYAAFADYLKFYVKDYAAANGVEIYAVSMANEPDTQIPWDGCAWLGDWIATFLGTHLRPAFASDPSITTKVIVPEAAVWDAVTAVRPPDPFYTDIFTTPCPPSGGTRCHPMAPSSLLGPTIANLNALSRVDLVAGHQYNGELSTALPSALTASRRTWMTEYSREGTRFMDTSLEIAEKIHTSLTGPAQVSAWLYFLYFGPSDAGDRDGSLVTTNGSATFFNRFFWVFGNYSKYVRPGMARIQAASTDAKLLASAFKDPQLGQRVVVVINKDTIPRTLKINGLGAGAVTEFLTTDAINLAPQGDLSLAFTISVPAQSIATFVGAPPRVTSDILWRNATTGNTMVWLGGAASTAHYPGALDGTWQVKGVGDFDTDGRGDILWRKSDGTNGVWHDGTNTSPEGLAPRDHNWRFQGLGSFDGNARSDLVWRCLPQAPATTCSGIAAGTVEIWLNANAATWRRFAAPDLSFAIQGVADFNGTGTSDILWRDSFGTLAIWWDGTATSSSPGGLDGHWKLEGVGELDGNGKADIVWRCLPIAPTTACGQAAAGSVAVWHDGTGTTTWHSLANANLVLKGIGDFDGDARGDLLWRLDSGAPVIWRAASGTDSVTLTNPGPGWDVAAIGRFDK